MSIQCRSRTSVLLYWFNYEFESDSSSYGFNPFPYLVLTVRTRIYETVPTTPRAAGDRSRGPGYMVWIHTIDT